MANQNFFELLNLPVSTTVDLELLKNNFQKAMQLVHPDQFGQDVFSQQQAVVLSSQLNDAYQVLRDPLSRIEHWLLLHDFESPEKNATIQDGRFLMQQMQWQEQRENPLEVPSVKKEMQDAYDEQIALLSALEPVKIVNKNNMITLAIQKARFLKKNLAQ